MQQNVYDLTLVNSLQPQRNAIVFLARPKVPSKSLQSSFLNKYTEQLKGLSTEQKEMVFRCAFAETYQCVVGMPGSGKTTALAALVQILHLNGRRVFLSAKTHQALDNLLLMLHDKVPVMRVANSKESVNEKLHRITHTRDRYSSVNDIRKAWKEHNIFAAICKDFKHSLLPRGFDYCVIDGASQVQ
jgi:DNA replication ATP-dependent helicase Dna2